ncbi:MAG: transporter substrate-binding domain-containing protein [Brevinematales bacterium]|nr:transporter substrate-binding domain-containing protein [Brevinematales bacterium]
MLLFLFSFAYSVSSLVWYESSVSYNQIILPEKESFLTEEELSWLSNHQIIRMAPDPHFAPFEFIDKAGKYRGIGADYLSLIEDMLGIKFEILIYSNWSDIIADFKAKKIDLLNTVVSNDIRNQYMLFSDPYLFIPSVIVGRKNETKKVRLEHLGEYRITMVKDYGLTGLVTEKYKGYKTILANNNTEALELLINKEADVFISDLATAEYYMRRGGYVNLEIVSVFKPDSVMGFGIRKDWEIFRNILNKTQKKIPPQIYTSILNKWIKIDLYNKKIIERVLIVSIIVFLSIILTISILLFFNYQLNQIIKRRTFELNLELERTKRLENELRESAEFLDEILNELPVPVLMVSEELKVLKSNIALKKFANVSVEELEKM